MPMPGGDLNGQCYTSPTSELLDDMRAALTFIPSNRHDTYSAINPAGADLSGKVVLITGASKGMGKAMALTIAQSGVRGLVLCARSSLSSVKEACLSLRRPSHSLQVLTTQVDVTNSDQVVALANEVEATFQRLDIVINNAGYLNTTLKFPDSNPDDWWRVWEVNIRGTYNVSRAFLPLLIKCDGDKTILNVTSVAALLQHPGFSAYSVRALGLSSGWSTEIRLIVAF